MPNVSHAQSGYNLNTLFYFQKLVFWIINLSVCNHITKFFLPFNIYFPYFGNKNKQIKLLMAVYH